MPSRKTSQKQAAGAQEEVKPPEGSRPWEDRSLSAEERYNSYKAVLKEHLVGVIAVLKREGILEHGRREILDNLEAKRWVSEAEQLDKETPEQFCARIDVPVVLGKNFLGAADWKTAFGVDVGAEPPLPATITKALLESECPLHPGKLIKDTHLLVLMPKTVNGEPYSALKLDQLCATRKGSGNKLISDDSDRRVLSCNTTILWDDLFNNGSSSWKNQDWASTSQPQGEWVLIPKSDPDPSKVSEDKYFRGKALKEQGRVHRLHYKEYREAKAVELITAVLLNDLINGEPRMLDNNYLNCKELSADGGRVRVGNFDARGLRVLDEAGLLCPPGIGRGLARKLET